jgi:hypothetical protein
MQLASTVTKSYEFLPSGILIVDPNPGLLMARVELLNAAEHYVAACDDDCAGTELRRIEVKVAILSQTLGRARLGTLAQEIRLYWPNACILLFGNVDLILENRLYDDSIDEHCRPEELLSALHWLRRDVGSRTESSRVRIGSSLFALSEGARMSLRSVPLESDPSKQTKFENQSTGRDVPWDEQFRN